MTLNKKIFIAFVLCFFSQTSFAAKKKVRFLPESFKAVFKQTYRSQLSGTLKSSSGKIDYKFPGHIRFETKKPDNIVFVSNKLKTWYYTAPFFKGEKGELSIQGASKNILTKFFDALNNGLNSNEIYKIIKVKNTYKMVFNKKPKKEIGIIEATLFFKGKDAKFSSLKELALTYIDKKKVRLTLSKMKTNPKFKKNHFFFVAPKNTKIMRR